MTTDVDVCMRCPAVPLEASVNSCTRVSSSGIPFLRWDHADRTGYYDSTCLLLSPRLKRVFCPTPVGSMHADEQRVSIDDIASKVTAVLNSCADIFVPRIRQSAITFWWDCEKKFVHLAVPLGT
jgi:hypothetical protein